MSGSEWLDGYSDQSTDELIALETTHRIDSLVLAFEQGIDQKRAVKGDRNLTAEEWIVLAVESLEREVMNGGFGQFFGNSSNEFAPFIIDALKNIGCPKSASITEQAITALGASDLTPQGIESAVERGGELLESALEECDDAFMEYPENIANHLFDFIKTNRNSILQ